MRLPNSLAIAGTALACFSATPQAFTQTISTEQLINGLQPKKTRGFDPTVPEREARQKELATKLRSFKTRQITVEARDEVVKLIKESEAPNVDVQILVAFDSDEILPEARPDLDALGKALSDEKLKSGSFLIAGHTDAKGGDDYNLDLSQRRAASVKGFLVETYHVDPARLAVIGFGEEQLKNQDDPFADKNRRVQIVNTGTAPVAESKPDATPAAGTETPAAQ
jgi:outer membrane protein OmpA-like peptidoglycan-associated protein